MTSKGKAPQFPVPASALNRIASSPNNPFNHAEHKLFSRFVVEHEQIFNSIEKQHEKDCSDSKAVDAPDARPKRTKMV